MSQHGTSDERQLAAEQLDKLPRSRWEMSEPPPGYRWATKEERDAYTGYAWNAPKIVRVA